MLQERIVAAFVACLILSGCSTIGTGDSLCDPLCDANCIPGCPDQEIITNTVSYSCNPPRIANCTPGCPDQKIITNTVNYSCNPPCNARCAPSRSDQKITTAEPPKPEEKPPTPKIQLKPIVVRATGYAALDNYKGRTHEQRLLLAMRGSKVDAYRAMAERVYGVALSSGTRLKNMEVADDRLRALVEAIIQGSKVVSQERLKTGGYQTILELSMSSDLQSCLAQNDPSQCGGVNNLEDPYYFD